MIALDLVVLGLAAAIFIGTLRLGKRPRSQSSATTRPGGDGWTSGGRP